MPEHHWTLTGNANTDPQDNFLGTTDNRDLVIKTNQTEAVHIDTQGRVGIGVTTPGQQLDVEGFVIAANGPDAFEVTCDPEGAHFWTNNAYSRSTPLVNWTRTLTMRDGKAGIGTASPAAKMHVSSGEDFNTPQIAIAQTTPNDFARLRFVSLGIDPDSGHRPFPLWDIAVGRDVMNFFRQDTGNVMTLTSGRPPGAAAFSPRVGIGREDPQATLDVNGTARVSVLEITGGGDLAEPFSVDEQNVAEAGTVMVIDDSQDGQLKTSDTAYDPKVAGIVSGAAGLEPGLTLEHRDTSGARVRVALSGRVYCKAESISNPIRPGDLLTTSHIRGHAMKAINPQTSRGAILGKAMSTLEQDKGLVLVLVS
jgi:hypothetical protein